MRRYAIIPLVALLVPATAMAQRASYEEIQTFSSVLNLIRLNHVDSVSYTPLVRAAIEGALGAVDPHSRYVRHEAEARLIATRSGELGSAGVELHGLRGAVTVMAVGRGSPAERAGVMPGDRIIAIADSSVAGLAPYEVELLLADERGRRRAVTIERGNPLEPARVDLTIRLDRYTWPNISSPLMLNDTVAYVRLDLFGERAAAELERALDRLRGRGMKRLVLDLRGNPGGLLIEAVNIAALFLPKDALVMRTVGRKRDANAEYRTRSGGDFQRLPLVVLVDGSSASAAEALTGALQDHRRAHIAGHRTFGKALVQMPFPLPAGDVLWLTTARVHTPAGRMIQRSYDGLSTGQYAAAAERLWRGGPDAGATGSGGIEPDTYFARRPEQPAWWDDARARGLDMLAVQRVQLPAADGDRIAWHAPLLDALRLVFAESADAALPTLTAEQANDVMRQLVHLAVGVRDGADAASEYIATTDPEVQRAISLFER